MFFLNANISAIKKERNDWKKVIEAKSVEKLAVLTDDEIKTLLNAKWISPIMDSIWKISSQIIKDLIKSLNSLSQKYGDSLVNIDREIISIEKEIEELLSNLEGGEYDIQGINKLKELLKGV